MSNQLDEPFGEKQTRVFKTSDDAHSLYLDHFPTVQELYKLFPFLASSALASDPHPRPSPLDSPPFQLPLSINEQHHSFLLRFHGSMIER